MKENGFLKVRINFKIYDVTDCEANNYNARNFPTSQEIKAIRQ